MKKPLRMFGAITGFVVAFAPLAVIGAMLATAVVIIAV